MRKLALSIAFIFSISSFALSANEGRIQKDKMAINTDCTKFSETLKNAATDPQLDIYATVAALVSACSSIADQVVEAAVSFAQADTHQQIMQSAADTGKMTPADILLAAIAGGGDPTLLSEPTAAGRLAITPSAPAATPPLIGGRNGGAPEPLAASPN